MSNIIQSAGIVPMSKVPMTTRLATMADVPFIDGLQKIHTHMVGWMPTKQIEGKIALGHVLVAEDEGRTPIGYCISQDTYSGRDDVGIVYQMNVVPRQQRNLIGASLLKAVFERAAYGCKLFCCWCAQDIAANYFWQSCGFVPLAFRTGSRGKQRIHIFWQRRVREGDRETPYWFPSATKAGAIREDRLVLPIPIGTDWRDAKPMLLPGAERSGEIEKKTAALPGRARPPVTTQSYARKMAIVRSQSRVLKGLPPGKAAIITSGGLKYVDRADYVPEPEPVKPKREPAPRAKHDPKQMAFVRELRDRYLEHVNGEEFALPAKYVVSRLLPERPGTAELPDAEAA